jgi:maltose O-acetyltransferase
MMRFIRSLYNFVRGGNRLSRLRAMGMVVGSNVKVMDQVMIDTSHCWLISLGDNVTLAPRVVLLAHDASMKKEIGYTKIGTIKIENGVFVGAGSIVLPGIKIGKNSIVGAGSVVTADIPANSVACGNPARVIKSRAEYLTKVTNDFKSLPVFTHDYTAVGKITQIKKEKMKRSLKPYGFIV